MKHSLTLTGKMVFQTSLLAKNAFALILNAEESTEEPNAKKAITVNGGLAIAATVMPLSAKKVCLEEYVFQMQI